MKLETQYLQYLNSLLESSNHTETKLILKDIREKFNSLLEAGSRGGNYNKYFTLHVGEGYGNHKFGDRIRAGGKKADMLLDYLLKLVDPKSEDNLKMEKKIINDFTKLYGVIVDPEYHSDGTLKSVKFKYDMQINNNGDIYMVDDNNDVIPVGPQIKNIPDQAGQQLYANAGDEIPDQMWLQYDRLRKAAIANKLEIYNVKLGAATFYNTQAQVGDEYVGDEESYERSAVGDNAQPLGTQKDLGNAFTKTTSGSAFGDGALPKQYDKTERNTSISLGKEIYDEAIALIEILENVPQLGDESLVKVLKAATDSTGNRVMLSTINKARRHLYKLATVSTIPAFKSALDELKSGVYAESRIIAMILDILNELLFDNFFNKGEGNNYGVNSTQTSFKKLLEPLSDYFGEDVYYKGRTIVSIRDNILSFLDNFIGYGETDGTKFIDDNALVPAIYNYLTDMSEEELVDE